jgi:toxin ParE1/3/4
MGGSRDQVAQKVVNRSVILRPRAEEDIRKAQLWYEQHQPGLGGQFLDEVDRGIKALEADADRFSIYYRNFRRILLPRFPYKLFYLVEGKRIIVFRVLHTKRKHQPFLPRVKN